MSRNVANGPARVPTNSSATSQQTSNSDRVARRKNTEERGTKTRDKKGFLRACLRNRCKRWWSKGEERKGMERNREKRGERTREGERIEGKKGGKRKGRGKGMKKRNRSH